MAALFGGWCVEHAFTATVLTGTFVAAFRAVVTSHFNSFSMGRVSGRY
jgi:hypothetical protein